MLISWDERRTLIILPSKELIPFVLDHFFTLFEEAVEKKGSFHVALSGGSTPKQLYAAIPSHPKAKNAPWDKIFLYWGDERAVSPESAESNYKMALDAGLSQLPILKENIFRMKAENKIEVHAKEYEEILKENLGTHGLDLIFLGMGEDGHTASLFPGTKALLEKSRYVVANEVPEKKCWRMTMTFPFINKSQNIVFLVQGASKQEMLLRLFSEEGEDLPSFAIGTKKHKALWVLDTEAAASLRK